LLEDASERILVFVRLGQYSNPKAKDIELEQENVRKQLLPTVCLIIYGSKQGAVERPKLFPDPGCVVQGIRQQLCFYG
jgi:hypothetical protein